MKTKTKLITKLLAVFAVIFLCLGVATISLTGQDSAIAAETTASTSTTTVKDGGFTGNLFNINSSTVKWGCGDTIANEVFTFSKKYSNSEYIFDVALNRKSGDTEISMGDTKASDSSLKYGNGLIWYDNGNPNYWIAGKTFNISFDYKIDLVEESKGYLQFNVLLNGTFKRSGNVNGVEGSSGWYTQTFQLDVADDYVKGSSANDFRIVFNNFKYGDHIQIKNIKVEMAGTPVEQGELICDMSGLTYTNSSVNHMTAEFKTTEAGDYVYDMVGTGALNSEGKATNTMLNTSRIAWRAGTTYELSFYIKTIKTATTPSWSLYPRAFEDDVANALLDCGTTIQLKDKYEGWTKFSYRFTPTKNATYTHSGNYFNLVISLGKDENIQIKDLTVTMSTVGLKNVGPTLKNVQGESDTVLSCSSADGVNTIKFNTAMPSNNNRSIWNTEMNWIDGVTYTVYFKIKTSDSISATVAVCLNALNGSTVWLCQATDVVNAKAVTEWKTICNTFTLNNINNNGSNGQKPTFRLLINGGAENDTIYYTDVKIYANLSDVTIKNGESTTTETVVTGNEYTLPEHTEVEGKTFIGWTVDNETLLNAGDKITVTGDTTVNAVLLDFATQEGTYFRLSEDTPGLRFITNADKEAIESTLKTYYGDSATFTYGMHVTAVDKDNNAIAGYMDIETTIWQKENKSFASAITGFDGKSQFCTATFTVTAYINVKISDTEIKKIEAKSYTANGSIVSLAETAYKDRIEVATDDYATLIVNDSHDTSLNGKYSKFSAEELEIIWNLSQLNATSGTTDEGSAE